MKYYNLCITLYFDKLKKKITISNYNVFPENLQLHLTFNIFIINQNYQKQIIF